MWWLIWYLFGGLTATAVFVLSGKARKWAARVDDQIDDEAAEAKAIAAVQKMMRGSGKTVAIVEDKS